MNAFGLSEEGIASKGGRKYVYYKRLATDKFNGKTIYKKIYDDAKGILDNIIGDNSRNASVEQIAQYFGQLRDAERNKEVALLAEKGFKNISKYEENNPKTGILLIQCFNKILNMWRTARYSLDLITKQNEQKKKGTIAYFQSYFNMAWNDYYLEQINNTIEKMISDNRSAQEINDYLLSLLPKIVNKAIEIMYNDSKASKELEKIYPWNLIKPYQKLYEEFNALNGSGNFFIEGLIESFGLRGYINDLANSINNQNFKGLPTSDIKVSFQKSGGAKEFETQLIAFIKMFKDSKFKSFHTGQTEIKSDLIYTYNINAGKIVNNWLNSIDIAQGRGYNVQKAQELKKKLKKFDEGFIVYVNQKDYNVLSDSFDGFPMDKSIKLREWDKMFQKAKVSGAGNQLVFSVLQTIPNAIGEKDKEKVSLMFSRAIAGALFDDFDVRGEIPEQGVKAIHLLHLNGIYLPLSFFYDLLSKGFKDAATRENLIKISIKTPNNIEFPTQKKQIAWENKNKQSAWIYQRNIALDNTFISFKIFSKFKETMRKLGQIF